MNLSLKIMGSTISEEDALKPSEMDYLIEIVNQEDKSPLLLSLPFSIRYLVAAFLLVSMLCVNKAIRVLNFTTSEALIG